MTIVYVFFFGLGVLIGFIFTCLLLIYKLDNALENDYLRLIENTNNEVNHG